MFFRGAIVNATVRKFKMSNPLDRRSVNILSEQKANLLLSDAHFLASWKKLVQESVVKTSIFQQPAFLVRWFRAKRNQFSPIIVTEYQGNHLTALLVLAMDIDCPSKKGKIVGAGEYDAEYQSWLCNHDDPMAFLENALGKVFGIYPHSQVSIRFFLDADLAAMLKLNSKLKKWLTIQEYKRPIADLQSPDFGKILRKRHLKAKINRFNRAGTAELEMIHEKERLLEVLPKVMLLYDFRQGALFNKYPSAKFMNESPLFVELIDSGTMHFSMLKLDGEIASCIVCYHDDTWVHLAGMITYSPFFAKLSPGLVHIYLLSEQLRSDGFKFFDLTPGYDGYKDKFATSNDMVFELTFSPNWISKVSKKTKVIFQDFLVRRGIRPMSLDLQIKKRKYLFGKKTMNIIKLTYKRTSTHSMELGLFRYKKNSIQELLNFQETTMLTKWEFLEDAFSKIEQGSQFITVTSGERLLSCIWLTQVQTENTKSHDEIEATINLIPNLDASYFDKSVLSRRQEIFESAIKSLDASIG